MLLDIYLYFKACFLKREKIDLVLGCAYMYVYLLLPRLVFPLLLQLLREREAVKREKRDRKQLAGYLQGVRGIRRKQEILDKGRKRKCATFKVEDKFCSVVSFVCFSLLCILGKSFANVKRYPSLKLKMYSTHAKISKVVITTK